MRWRSLASFETWDEYGLLQAELGRQTETDEGVAPAMRTFAGLPRITSIVVEPEKTGFIVRPAPGQPTAQVALAKLLRSVQNPGWRIINLSARFEPRLAFKLAKIMGLRMLRHKNSWMKLSVPMNLFVEREVQTHPRAVDNMLEAFAAAKVVEVDEFVALSIRCIAATLTDEDARRYYEVMR